MQDSTTALVYMAYYTNLSPDSSGGVQTVPESRRRPDGSRQCPGGSRRLQTAFSRTGYQASNKLGEWLNDWVAYAIFFHSNGGHCDFLSNGGHERNKIWHKGCLGGKDDARTLNTCIAQRKCTIPHSTMKTNGNIIHIQCCNNTHQRVLCTGKQTCAALRTLMTLVT